MAHANQAGEDFNQGTIHGATGKAYETKNGYFIPWLPPLGQKCLRKGRFWAPTEHSCKEKAIHGKWDTAFPLELEGSKPLECTPPPPPHPPSPSPADGFH